MADVPRTLMDELFLEIELTNVRYIIVEGPSDARFFRAWLADCDLGPQTAVLYVDEIDVSSEMVRSLGLNDGNRSRVIVFSMRAAERMIDLRCIADRDCGHGIEDYSHDTLLWTDFPALESYAVTEAVLDRANLLSFAEKLPPARELVPRLAFALRELYAVRLRHPHLPGPKYSAGFAQKTSSLEDFDVVRAVEARIRSEVPGYERPIDADPRNFAYGHDIAELLLAAYGNALKNTVGLAKREAVEAALMNAVLAVGAFRDSPLFVQLRHWIEDDRCSS